MRRIGAVLLVLLGLVGITATAPAALSPGAIEEAPVPSAADDRGEVVESFVRTYDPLPASAGPHPPACDWLGHLRFRHRDGPARATDADAVVVLIPGFLGGAANFDQVARNTVRNASARGRFVEVWALDRRANCLEDHTGVVAAARARDPAVAYDYYWGGREVDGKRFEGFASATEAGFLREFGLARTIRDWHTVLTRGIPNPRQRAEKVICGGHSLGGPLTAAFASWDFDGDPGTTADAGYNQCAGLVGFDTLVTIGGTSGGGPGLFDVFGVGGRTGATPFVDVPPLTPETIQLPPVFAVGAFHHPGSTDLIRRLPRTANIDLAQRVLFSRDAVNFATGVPSIRDFNLSNELVLAGVFDDNSAALSFLRASLGQAVGGPLADKKFPTPDETMAIPEEPATPLYSWQSYDRVGTDGAPIALNDAGRPYTSRESEVTSLREFARTHFEAPANYIEQYFPTKILVDVLAAEGGDRGGDLAALRHDGPGMRPLLLIQAGDSDDNSAPDTGEPTLGAERPNRFSSSRELTLPGYNHLDVVGAARTQNDGRPEPASAALTAFVLEVVGSARPKRVRLSVRPRRVRAGRVVRLRVAVRSSAAACRRGVLLRVTGRRVRTDSRGRATLRARFRKAGLRRIVASKRGCQTRRASVRVLTPRRG
jgi:hypothetical protein